MNEEKNGKQFHKGIPQNGCLLAGLPFPPVPLSLCGASGAATCGTPPRSCDRVEWLVPSPNYIAQCGPFSESRTQIQIAPKLYRMQCEHSCCPQQADERAPFVCYHTPILEHPFWLLIGDFFPLRISNVCLLVSWLLTYTQRVIIPSQICRCH